jgi:hypothetical protein
MPRAQGCAGAARVNLAQRSVQRDAHDCRDAGGRATQEQLPRSGVSQVGTASILVVLCETDTIAPHIHVLTRDIPFILNISTAATHSLPNLNPLLRSQIQRIRLTKLKHLIKLRNIPNHTIDPILSR